MKNQNELIADKVYDLIKYAIYSEDFYGDISEKIEGGINEATAPLEVRIQELETELQQAKTKELEACIETVKTLTPYLSKYHSNVSSEPTRKDIIEALEMRKYLPK